MKQTIWLFFLVVFATKKITAQVIYPYPLHYFTLTLEDKKCRLAFMDLRPEVANGKTILLFHGKNFNGYYWKDFIPVLQAKGYRVIVPDQLGWGESDKPDLHYSFHQMARNNQLLLDSLQLEKVTVIGHSMGGMLAIRFALLYPEKIDKLILENPIGLEDYKTFIPYQTLHQLYQKEKSATYASYKKYQQTYYPEWKPAYEQYVQAQAAALTDSAFEKIAWINAITYQMIYEQPVCYELDAITAPTLLIIGLADRTVVGKDLLPAAQKNKFGQYPELAKKAKQQIKNASVVGLDNVGHIPHIQTPFLFEKAVFAFLE